MSDNRREFFRLVFDRMIEGEISVQEQAPVLMKIDNISVGGLGFVSALDIAMPENVECGFNLLGHSFLIRGKIIRKVPQTNYIEYGVGFDIDQDTASELFKQLNYYHIRQRKRTLPK
ncbi:PilZ domain-containing protein [Planococcus salinus]|uniref:PilZ domain-containing protein n=1 Tax=Planococcus salinus TaxID=1848460 RepID=A0A3M8P4Z7_9BACL|nr:PilZ domain-containing protein [Planococcus salinus]RNF38737.1 PilZ domain-containing protein [Planococcus salinus]